jgi:penicillin-binding protein 1A
MEEFMFKKLNVGKHFKKRSKMPHFGLSVFVTTLKMFLIFALILAFAGFGTIIGIATGYMEATPVLDIRQIEEQAEASFIYDRYGNLITTYHGLENRIWASIDEIPPVLENAFIAIEDVRFNSHNGIDLKRIAGSFVNNILNESLQGGSTITQQLIKNTLLTPERTYKRKIQEAYLAIQLEQKYTKDQILEAYLNTIYLGNGNHGVKTAALDYFGKELTDLTVREAAVLAGVVRSPARFNPRRNMHNPDRKEILFNRANTVLNAMYENGFISQQEFDSARFGEDELAGVFSDGFKVVKEPTNRQLYDMPHFIEYVIKDVAEHLMKQNGWEGEDGMQQAIELIHEGGLHIYTTVDSAIQLKAEEVVYTYDNFPEMAVPDNSVLRDAQGNETAQPQAAVVIIDHTSGEIRALVGGRTPPRGRFWLNRANESWPVGSAIKPLSVYAPFIEAGYPGGVILENVPGPITGWDIGGGKWGYPRNFTVGDEQGTYTGPVTAREALARSFNTTAARGVFRVTPELSAQKLKELGITSELYVEDKHPSNLALGSDGINMIEFTAAYAAIANRGEYLKPISFTRVLDRNGNEILNSSDFQVRREVFRETTAFILTEWLKDAASPSGTGRRAMFGNMPVAGKTGTNQDLKGVFFAGFTPYYTASVWIGHDRLQSLSNATAGRFAAPLWSKVMEPIHKEHNPKPFFAEVPQGLVQMQVCGISGMLPNGTLCDNHLVTEWFPRDAIPRDICTIHQMTTVCRYSGKLLTPNCPPEHAMQRSVVILPEGSPLAQLSDEDLARHLPGAVRGGIEGITDLTTLDYNNPAHRHLFCPLHTQEWANAEASRAALISQAWTLIYEVNSNINNQLYELRLSIDDRNRLNEQVAVLQMSLEQATVETPPETGPFLTQIPMFNAALVQSHINTLWELNRSIFDRLHSDNESEQLDNESEQTQNE